MTDWIRSFFQIKRTCDVRQQQKSQSATYYYTY